MDKKITVDAKAAHTVLEWMESGRGVALWSSANLSNPGASWLTPGDGKKPTWQAANNPKVTYNLEDVFVVEYDEVERFPVYVRWGQSGLSLKLQDRSQKALDRALDRHEGSSYVFDYATQEAVILAPTGLVTLQEWSQSR